MSTTKTKKPAAAAPKKIAGRKALAMPTVKGYDPTERDVAAWASKDATEEQLHTMGMALRFRAIPAGERTAEQRAVLQRANVIRWTLAGRVAGSKAEREARSERARNAAVTKNAAARKAARAKVAKKKAAAKKSAK